MYSGNKNTLKALIPPFIAQIVIMVVSLSVSLPHIMTSPHCVQTAFPVSIIAYRCGVNRVLSYLFIIIITMLQPHVYCVRGFSVWIGNMEILDGAEPRLAASLVAAGACPRQYVDVPDSIWYVTLKSICDKHRIANRQYSRKLYEHGSFHPCTNNVRQYGLPVSPA
jgi:hypothetical protein